MADAAVAMPSTSAASLVESPTGAWVGVGLGVGRVGGKPTMLVCL